MAGQGERHGGGVVRRRFVSNEDAPRAARAMARDIINGLDETSAANLYVVLSELVTNAVVHGKGDVRVSISQDNHHIRVEVADSGTGYFTPPARTQERLRAHGLEIVEAFTDRHGIEHTPETLAWCELDLPVV